MSGITQAVRYTTLYTATLPSSYKLNSVGTILRNINPFHSFNGRQRQGLNYVKLLLGCFSKWFYSREEVSKLAMAVANLQTDFLFNMY